MCFFPWVHREEMAPRAPLELRCLFALGAGLPLRHWAVATCLLAALSSECTQACSGRGAALLT